MNGAVADFNGRLDHLELENGGELSGSAHVTGLIDVENTHFDINVDKLAASTSEITYLLNNIANLSLGEGEVGKYLKNIESVDATGAFVGTIRNFNVKVNSGVASGGAVALDCNMLNPISGRKKIAVNSISTQNLRVGQIISNNLFGKLTLAATGDVELGGTKSPNINCTVNVDNIELFGRNFKAATIVANSKNDCANFNVSMMDPALQFVTPSSLNVDWSNRSNLKYGGTVKVHHADLRALGVNERDSISVIKGVVGVSAYGSSLNEINGVVRISDASYKTTNGRVCETESLVVRAKSDGKTRNITLSSNFADATFNSSVAYEEVLYYIKHLLVPYASNLYDEKARTEFANHVAQKGDNSANLTVKTKEALDSLLVCIRDGLEVADKSKISMLMRPSKDYFKVNIKSEYLEYNNNLMTNIEASADKKNDAMMVSLTASDVYVGVLHASEVNVAGGIKDNNIDVDAKIADSLQRFEGKVSADIDITRNHNRPNVSIKLNPSSLSLGDTSWSITTDGIYADSARIDIRRFVVRNASEELYVDGVLSHNDNDSLDIKMREFSLSPITQITRKIGYVINGKADGYAKLHSVLKDTRIDAQIELDSLDVSGTAIPDLKLVSKWDFSRSQASLNVSTRADGNTIIKGYFMPSKMRYYAELKANGVDMGVLDPLLSGVITDTEGRADVDVKLDGKGRMASLSGDIAVYDLATTVDYTKCRYSAPMSIVSIADNRFTVVNTPVTSQNGGEGTLSLDFSLAHLSNIEYNVDLKVKDMQVLNTTEKDNSMFYGSIFASGEGTIRGNKAGVNMNFSAKSGDNSKFYMPLTSDSSVLLPKYVKFVNDRDEDSEADDNNRLTKKIEAHKRNRASTEGGMDIKMALNISPNTEVQLVIDPTVGDIIKGSGNGMLDLHVNTQRDIFTMNGDFTIEKGDYLFTLQNVINKRFEINPGSKIQWTGDPMGAILNIDAVYKLKASLQPLLEGSLTDGRRSTRAVPVNCIIHLTETMMKPKVDFGIEVENADSDVKNIIASALATPESLSQQFAYLIVANSFISEATNTLSPSLGVSATVATGMELLSNQLSNFLSADNYKIILRYRPRTDVLSDEVDFGFSKELLNDRLLVEVEGNYIRDKSQVVNATSNITGEAYLTWLVDAAGTLRLKGFTHTIDRFDENQGLQETGVGIYFKEDFDNAQDLKYRLKQRFKRETKNREEKSVSDTTEVAQRNRKTMKKNIQQQTK
jgi:hypothetical protein